ncbi:hypothetical protein HK101_004809 [Irineochytrium annulatum]|nr:hypothetical protein HK101_004809 [Irineochytrium annulatum]
MAPSATGCIKAVTVFCGSSEGKRPVYKDQAEALGRLLAESGLKMVYGGGDMGLMGATARSAAANGGSVLGILPKAMIYAEGRNKVGETILVPDMHTRKQLMNKNCDAFVVLPGGYGTFEEVMEVTTWVQIYIIRKPIVVVNAAGYFDPMRQMIDTGIREGFIKEDNRGIVTFVETAQEAIDFLLKYDTPNDLTGAPLQWEAGSP